MQLTFKCAQCLNDLKYGVKLCPHCKNWLDWIPINQMPSTARGIIWIFGLVRTKRDLKDEEERDTRYAAVLHQGIKALLQQRPIGASNIRCYESCRLGEVTRHFDVNTSASIRGWITHDLGFHGWGAGVGMDRSGLGVARIGLSGTSEVFLTSTGTNRDDLMGDGFVAVLEKNDGQTIDTLRLVVPSENSIREQVTPWLSGLISPSREKESTIWAGARWHPDRYKKCRLAWAATLPELLSFKCETSYVSDRLNSILRMPTESRPLLTVYGSMISEHAILGSGIRIGDDNRTFPLFPISLIKNINQLLDQTVAVVGVEAGRAATQRQFQNLRNY